jgi:hypothetical protein
MYRTPPARHHLRTPKNGVRSPKNWLRMFKMSPPTGAPPTFPCQLMTNAEYSLRQRGGPLPQELASNVQNVPADRGTAYLSPSAHGQPGGTAYANVGVRSPQDWLRMFKMPAPAGAPRTSPASSSPIGFEFSNCPAPHPTLPISHRLTTSAEPSYDGSSHVLGQTLSRGVSRLAVNQFSFRDKLKRFI